MKIIGSGYKPDFSNLVNFVKFKYSVKISVWGLKPVIMKLIYSLKVVNYDNILVHTKGT